MPTTDPRIRALTDQFVADLSAVIHEAALEAVREALGDVPAHKAPGRGRRKATRKKASNGRRKKAGRKKAARGGKRVRRSSGDVEATASAILAHVRASPGSSVGDVGDALGLTTKDLRLPIQNLLAEKKLRTEGERRGTRYFAGKGGGRKKAAKKATRKKPAKKKASPKKRTTSKRATKRSAASSSAQ